MLITSINENTKRKRPRIFSPTYLFLLVVIFVLTVSNTYLFYNEVIGKETNNTKQVEDILKNLDTIYAVPDEEPTIVTIKDVEKLKIQEPEFYKDAQNGDKVIVFLTKKIALLYRYKENRIINIAPVAYDVNNTASE